MKLLKKPLIRKCKLEDLTIDNLFIAVPYLYDDNTNEYKMELNIGGQANWSEWYTSDDFILLSEIDKDFYVKDINKLTGKQRSYIYFKYKNYLERKGELEMENLRTREVAELFGLTLNQFNGLFYNTIPEPLRPNKVEFSDGGNGYYYTDKDLGIIEKAIEYKKTMKNKEVKDKLEKEYLVSTNANTDPLQHVYDFFSESPQDKLEIETIYFTTQLVFNNDKVTINNKEYIKVFLRNGEVLVGIPDKSSDDEIILKRMLSYASEKIKFKDILKIEKVGE